VIATVAEVLRVENLERRHREKLQEVSESERRHREKLQEVSHLLNRKYTRAEQDDAAPAAGLQARLPAVLSLAEEIAEEADEEHHHNKSSSSAPPYFWLKRSVRGLCSSSSSL